MLSRERENTSVSYYNNEMVIYFEKCDLEFTKLILATFIHHGESVVRHSTDSDSIVTVLVNNDNNDNIE